jgi:uncharacterized protein (DUF1684 family)
MGQTASFKIGPTPEEAAQAEYLPFELTQAERTNAARAALFLEKRRRELNRQEDAKALAGVLWLSDDELAEAEQAQVRA